MGPFPSHTGGAGQSDQGQSHGVSGDVTPRSGQWGDVDNLDRHHQPWAGGPGSLDRFRSSSFYHTKCVNKSMEVVVLKSFIEVRAKVAS